MKVKRRTTEVKVKKRTKEVKVKKRTKEVKVKKRKRVVGNDIGQQIHLLHRILRARKRICLWVVKYLM